jgi:hypothetical protein
LRLRYDARTLACGSAAVEVAGLGEDPAHHRLEERERQRFVVRIEAVLVVELAELGAGVEVGWSR